jgi:hypothetical protein
MSSETTSAVGGFVGDPAEAFIPPTMGSCCGSSPAPAADRETVAAGSCCGTVAEAAASGGCCGETVKAQAVASGAGCCG